VALACGYGSGDRSVAEQATVRAKRGAVPSGSTQRTIDHQLAMKTAAIRPSDGISRWGDGDRLSFAISPNPTGDRGLPCIVVRLSLLLGSGPDGVRWSRL